MLTSIANRPVIIPITGWLLCVPLVGVQGERSCAGLWTLVTAMAATARIVDGSGWRRQWLATAVVGDGSGWRRQWLATAMAGDGSGGDDSGCDGSG